MVETEQVAQESIQVAQELCRDYWRRGVIAALCFGGIFGGPFIIWGLILVFDRDRSWQKALQRSAGDKPIQRTRDWDRRQVIYGVLLIAFGSTVLMLLGVFNYLAQQISPPAPF